jgi:hypothetical protein
MSVEKSARVVLPDRDRASQIPTDCQHTAIVPFLFQPGHYANLFRPWPLERGMKMANEVRKRLQDLGPWARVNVIGIRGIVPFNLPHIGTRCPVVA